MGSVALAMLRAPFLQLVAGIVLLVIAVRLTLVRDDENTQVDPATALRSGGQRRVNLFGAIWSIIAADAAMSLDNVIAVAAIAQGSLVLLAIGLVASIPIIIAGAALIMVMLDRFPIFIWAGAALLGWIAGDVMATDPAVFGYMSAKLGETFARQVEFAAAGAGALLVIGVGGLWRQLSLSKAHAVSGGEAAGGN
jgi:YjbE family integral membrane protein